MLKDITGVLYSESIDPTLNALALSLSFFSVLTGWQVAKISVYASNTKIKYIYNMLLSLLKQFRVFAIMEN